MKIFLIRHAESEWNKRDIVQGQSDPELSQKGRGQAKQLAASLQEERIRVVYTSRLKRALNTARGFADSLKVPLVQEDGLEEMNFGEWEGKAITDINAHYNNAHAKWLLVPSSVDIPGAETAEGFKERAVQAFQKIVKENNGKNIAIVTHGGVIRSIISGILAADLDSLIRGLEICNTGITLVEREEERLIVKYVNSTAHLNNLAEFKAL